MTGLYIHIPFCLRKCPYCGFNSGPAAPGLVEDYVTALSDELRELGAGTGEALESVYLGGGTPSLLSGRQLERILVAARAAFKLREEAEVTVEINPGTLDAGKARALRSLGVNRASVGVQAMRDPLLRLLGRVHTRREALDCLAELRRAGFDNLSADLIYGLPGQSAADWGKDLETLLGFDPEHLSLYELTVEPGTPFARRRRRGTLDLPPEEETVAMYRRAESVLGERGHVHYEISNWARPGRECRHNLLYWTGADYLGAGAGAHSFRARPEPLRWWNVKDPVAYVRRRGQGNPVAVRRERLSRETWLAERLMLGLRLVDGVSRSAFKAETGADPLELFGSALEEAFRRGWISKAAGRLRLTEEGIIFSDSVFQRLF